MTWQYLDYEIKAIQTVYPTEGAEACLALMQPFRTKQGLYSKAQALGVVVPKEVSRKVMRKVAAKKFPNAKKVKPKAKKVPPAGAIVINGHVCLPKPPGPRHAAYMAGGK